MKRILLNDPERTAFLNQLYERALCPETIEKSTREIVEKVHKDGDDAIVEYIRRFDGADITPAEFLVSEQEFAEAEKSMDESAKDAIDMALRNITAFAKECLPHDHSFSPRPGVVLGEKFTPMQRVGCYVPGGTAPLVSTVVHTIAIAKAAGVPEIVACTPPMKNSGGKINPATLYAMRRAGATEVWRMGGAYAVAAMAFGTKTVRKVEKIVGPGNAFVAAAKKLVYGHTAIDMVAGPSEVMLIADSRTNPAFAAADMLSQAEHGSGLEQAVLVSDSPEMLDAVQAEIEKQCLSLPKIETVRKVMDNGMFFIQSRDLHEAAEIATKFAPEHLEVLTADPRGLLPELNAAGAIFLGEWTPEPAGDFTAGPSHVLPTAGTARFFHGLTAGDFMRRSSTLEYTQEALLKEIPAIVKFAELEGLAAHGRSAAVRGEKKN